MTMREDIPYLCEYAGRTYVRRHGRKIRLLSASGTADFMREYGDALDRLEGRPPGSSASAIAPKGSLGWLAARYFASAPFGRLHPRSQATRRGVIEECLREPPKPDSRSTMAVCPIPQVNAAAIIMLMERKDGLPGAANNRKKYLSAMFRWGVKHLRDHVKANPCRDAEKVAYSTDGYHTWTVEEVRQYLSRHPVGTKAALFLALMLFTGARSEDAITFGRQHTITGALRYIPKKTLYKRRKTVEKQILPALAEILSASPVGDLTYLVNDYGRPFTEKGIGNKMRQWCDQAGLFECTAHGLKKAAATIAADNGATLHELMAMFDWTTPSQAEPYTRQADQKKLAANTAKLITLGTVPPKRVVSRGEN
jgi:integrase